jgi:hypothetical protein
MLLILIHSLSQLEETKSFKYLQRFNPTIQSKAEDHTGSSTIYRQDGAADILFVGLGDVTNGAATIYVVVTDKNRIAVSGATVGLDLNPGGSSSLSANAATAVTDLAGVAQFSISGWISGDEFTVWSVSGDLDSASNYASYTTKNGTPDNDVTIPFGSGGVSDVTFGWFSESTRLVYGFEGIQVGTEFGVRLNTVNVADANTDIIAEGSNITQSSLVKSAAYGQGVSFQNGDAGVAGFLHGWCASKTGTEANSRLQLSLNDSTTTVTSTSLATAPDQTDLLQYPMLHTYDDLANWVDNAFAADPITANIVYSTGQLFLSEEIGIADQLYIEYTIDGFAAALDGLENKEFRLIAPAGKSSADDLIIFKNFIEGRKNVLPTFGCFALDAKSTANGNGADYTMSSVGQSNFVKLVAHDDGDYEVAAAVAAAVIGINPWDSSAFLTVIGVNNATEFTQTEINSYTDAQIDVIDKPMYYDTISPVLSYGFCIGPRTKADVQLTVNYIDVAVKRVLSSPALIGRTRVSYDGISSLVALGETVLFPLIEIGAIGPTSRIFVPLLEILKKPASARTITEQAIIDAAQVNREVPGEIIIDYQGSIEQISIGINFV